MKNLLLGTIVLLTFAASIVIIQTSCSKAEARPTSEPINKILYVTRNGKIWTANYDGTNAAVVNIALPPNILVDMSIPRMSIKLSPDGQKIFFNAIDSSTRNSSTTGTFDVSIYSCDISGNNVVPVIIPPAGQNMLEEPILCGAY